jgi:hypothetical protein
MSSCACWKEEVDANSFASFSALGVSGHPHPLLGHVAELAVLSGEDLAERISMRDRSNAVSRRFDPSRSGWLP